MTQSQIKTLFLPGAIVIFIGAFWLQVGYLLWGDWGVDEGYYLLVAHLMNKGFSPYQEIYMSEPPGMIWSIDIPLQIFGSIWGMRYAMACFALIGIASTISIGRILVGPITALIAGTLLSFSYSYFFYTHGVDPGPPSLSFGLVAITIALYYRVSGRKLWLVLSAIAMAASFLVKIYMIVAFLMITLVLIFYPTIKSPAKSMR